MIHTFNVTSNQGSFPFQCFDNPSSKFVSSKIFEGFPYRAIPFVKDVRVILDVGANVGAFSSYFALLYPTAEIYSFEPAQAPYTLLAQNTKRFPHIITHPFGLYSSSKMTGLHRSKTDSVTGSIRKSVLNTDDVEIVELRSITEWLVQAQLPSIDILKIDTEGCELEILRAIPQIVAKVSVLYIEYHSEEARLAIDAIMTPTHTLYASFAEFSHLGDLTYVRSDINTPDNAHHARRVVE